MTTKTILMTALLTAASVCVGCASREAGTMDDQNYREVKSPPEQIADEPPAPALITLPNAEDGTTETASSTPANASATPSLGAHERDWELIIYRPNPGTTAHNPVYFRDSQTGYTPQPDPTRTPGPGFDAALSGGDADTWSAGNLLNGAVQPMKFALDTALLPLHVVVKPPLSYETTPAQPAK